MGVSTSFFICGCKLHHNRKTSKSKKSLLSNGSTITGVSNRSSQNHLVVGDNNFKQLCNDTLPLSHSFISEDKESLDAPWSPIMDIHENNQQLSVKSSPKMHLQLGAMRITKPTFKALLVLSKKEDSCQSWQICLTKLGFDYDIVHSEQSCLELFEKHHHHLIIIEYQLKKFDVESLCKSLRMNSVGTYSTIVGLLPRRNPIAEISKTQELLNAGMDRIVYHPSSLQELEDELSQLEAGPLTLQHKFRTLQALFTALNHVRDLIQITDADFQIQFANTMYGTVTGFAVEHIVGCNLSDCFENEKNEEDAWKRIKETVQRGEEWEGDLYTKRKSGPDIQLTVFILPLKNQDGCIHQYLVVSHFPGNNSHMMELSMIPGAKRKNSDDMHWKGAGDQPRRPSIVSVMDGTDASHRRNNSLAKIHSMSIEAPITQIINLISIIKENSQPSVSEVLDRILEILRNSELYFPADFPNRAFDPMLSDFVDGLVAGSGSGHRRASGGTGEHLFGKTPPSGAFKSSVASHHHPSVVVSDPTVAQCLQGFDSWDYDVLALERISSKKPLVHMAMHCLGDFNICEVLECSQNTLHNWLMLIESNYHSSNPYHNSTHAADVLHATAYFLKKDRVKTWMEPLDEVAALLAAIIHDVDHPGRTNAFLVNSNNPLALLYNDTAVLESHHAAFTFKFTVTSETCNIFKNMSTENFRTIRQSMIDMVLATELSKHFEHVNKFVSIITKNNSSLSNEQEDPSSKRASEAVNPAVLHELKVLIKRMLIKVADVGNPARKTSLCVEWARRIAEEYFSQTDEEKRLGLPVVMPHFDRKTCSLPKSQMTFIDYFLKDMFEAWHEFCGLEDVMKNLNSNYEYWMELEDRGIMSLSEIEDIDAELKKVEERITKEDEATGQDGIGNHLS